MRERGGGGLRRLFDSPMPKMPKIEREIARPNDVPNDRAAFFVNASMGVSGPFFAAGGLGVF